MNIVIDGYNMIKQAFKKASITEAERAHVLARLDAYARRKNHTIHIIFDGGPYERPTKERKGSLTIVYSGRKLSADDVIKTYIEEKILAGMLVVTTDRNLNAFARSHSVTSIDSIDFYDFMNEQPLKKTGLQKAPGAAHKLHTSDESPELDVLMQQGSDFLFYKDELQDQEENKGKKRSKQEKQLYKVIKKL